MKNNPAPLVSDYRVPPGHYIREALEHHDFTESHLASRLGESSLFVAALLRGDRRITKTVAAKLQTALGIPAHVWLNLERLYKARSIP